MIGVGVDGLDAGDVAAGDAAGLAVCNEKSEQRVRQGGFRRCVRRKEVFLF